MQNDPPPKAPSPANMLSSPSLPLCPSPVNSWSAGFGPTTPSAASGALAATTLCSVGIAFPRAVNHCALIDVFVTVADDQAWMAVGALEHVQAVPMERI